MARPLTFMTATLATAVVAGVLPAVLSTSSPPPPIVSVAPSNTNAVAPSPPATGSANSLSRLGVAPASGLVSTDGNGLSFRVKDGVATAHTLVRNETDQKQTLTLEFVLQDRYGDEVKSSPNQPNSPVVLNANEVRVLAIQTPLPQTASLPVSGLLRIRSEGTDSNGKPVTKYSDRSITVARLAEPGCMPLFVLPLVAAGVIVVITALRLLVAKVSLGKRMGSATWNFGQSWGANVAIAGGLLGIFLTTLTFPEQASLDRSSYAMLQALFAGIIALAAPLYSLIRTDVQSKTPAGLATTDSQGYVIMFLLAGGLVLWGALGQVFILAKLVEEYVSAGTLNDVIGTVLRVLAAFLAILLTVYGLRSLYQTAKELSKTPPAQPAGAAAVRFPNGMPIPAPLQPNFDSPLPEWSLP